MRIYSLVLLFLLASSAEAQVMSFSTTDPPAPIPDATPSLDACQTITVPISVTLNRVDVEVTSTHTWVGDVTFQLSRSISANSPSPRRGNASGTLTIINRPGRTGTGSGHSDDLVEAVPIRFEDFAGSGSSAENLGAPPCGGTIDGSADCPDNYIPAPDVTDTPFPGQGVDFATTFGGQDSQGDWILCAGDSAAGDTGTLLSWTLFINEIIPVELQSFSID